MKTIHSETRIPHSFLGKAWSFPSILQIQDDEQSKFFNFLKAAKFSSDLNTALQLQLHVFFGKSRGWDSVLVVESD